MIHVDLEFERDGQSFSFVSEWQTSTNNLGVPNSTFEELEMKNYSVSIWNEEKEAWVLLPSQHQKRLRDLYFDEAEGKALNLKDQEEI